MNTRDITLLQKGARKKKVIEYRSSKTSKSAWGAFCKSSADSPQSSQALLNSSFFCTHLFPPASVRSIQIRFLGRRGPGLGPVQRSGRRLGPSGPARSMTSSRAGASACAGPGMARALPSAVWPTACWTATESTLHQRRATPLSQGLAVLAEICARGGRQGA